MNKAISLSHRFNMDIMNKKGTRFAYRKYIASKMRRDGFKFHPICTNENKEEGGIRRCDYRFSLNITDKHILIEINL